MLVLVMRHVAHDTEIKNFLNDEIFAGGTFRQIQTHNSVLALSFYWQKVYQTRNELHRKYKLRLS